MQLKWQRCKGGVWCLFNKIPVQDAHFNGLRGVVIVWNGVKARNILYVGKGDIRLAMQVLRRDPTVQLHELRSPLLVTWAQAPEESIDGVFRYLCDELSPKMVDKMVDKPPIKVNLPW